MFNRFTLTLGRRYATARQGSHLVSFISRMSVIGLVISVALLILVMAIMNGFDRELRERILQVMPQGTLYSRDGIHDPAAVMAQALQHPEVEAAAPFVSLQGLLAKGKNVAPVGMFGIVPALEVKASGVDQYLIHNRLNELTDNAHAVVLGSTLANSLQTEVGDRLTLVIPRAGAGRSSPSIWTLEVVDILATGTEVDNNLALMNMAAASKLTAYPGSVSGVRLKLRDLFRAPTTMYEVTANLAPNIYGRDWTRSHGNLYQAIHMSKKLVGLLLILLIGIAAFNLVTTLIMVVVDKESDIAILRTQGASSSDIVGIFLVQGGYIGVTGTFIGVVLGVVFSYTVTSAVAGLEHLIGFQFLHSDVYPVSYLPAELLLSDVLYIAGAALVLSFMASVYPAWRASRVLPAEALRHE
ncbi:lipoprotein-releasing ABC transporter permease subunit [Gilvimarinus polysaccharolyticus]|uniref:lipoprotein-releasing ABC transporter permease subunit n=1 Tax=Gilvimarinus polysaccharolyticus TaxID=863921 RepID=UPI0006739F28|nr:lipoprotein-releasing ABC transporter permease subunit [Gilvimarinus polysaccharolyticus]